MKRKRKHGGAGRKVAVGYVRVSTIRQADDGVSLDAQRAKVVELAKARGYDLRAIHSDNGISGASADNRPGLQSAIDDACQHGGALVFYSLSRLARSVRDAIDIAARLDRSGADMVSITEPIDTTSAVGKLTFTILSALAECERDLTSERTRSAMDYKRSIGERTSRFAPYGFRFTGDNRLEPVERERQAVALAVKLRKRGKVYRVIDETLRRAGYAPRSGGVWRPSVLRAIIEREPQ